MTLNVERTNGTTLTLNLSVVRCYWIVVRAGQQQIIQGSGFPRLSHTRVAHNHDNHHKIGFYRQFTAAMNHLAARGKGSLFLENRAGSTTSAVKEGHTTCLETDCCFTLVEQPNPSKDKNHRNLSIKHTKDWSKPLCYVQKILQSI